MESDGELLRERLLELLERVAPRPLSIPELARRLELERYDHRALARLLDAQVALRKLPAISVSRPCCRRKPATLPAPPALST